MLTLTPHKSVPTFLPEVLFQIFAVPSIDPVINMELFTWQDTLFTVSEKKIEHFKYKIYAL